MKTMFTRFHMLLLFVSFALLGGCAAGVNLIDSSKRVTDVPPIGADFNRIPVSVAVYITPQILASHAIFDHHTGWSYPYIIDYAPIGTDIAAAITNYVPYVFQSSYLITNFPDPRLLLNKVDLVLVIEHVADSAWATMGQGGWDVSLTAGLYRPDGVLIKRYTVVATYTPPTPVFLNGVSPPWANWMISESHKSVAPAMRLLLQRFPREEIVRYLNSHRLTAKARADLGHAGTTYWDVQRQAYEMGIMADKPALPKPDHTIWQFVQEVNASNASIMALDSAVTTLGTSYAAQEYASNPTAFNQQMLEVGIVNQAVSQALLQQYQDIAAGKDPSTTPFLFRFLGGLSNATQTAASAMPMTGAMGSNQGTNDTRIGQVCQANVNRLSSSSAQNQTERQTTCLYYCYYTATHSQQLYANYLTAQKYANDLCDGRVSTTCNTITNIDSKCGYR